MDASAPTILLAPYLVGLYQPESITPLLALAAPAAFLTLRAPALSTAARRLKAAVLGLLAYLAASQMLALVVDRADRDFQEWFWERQAGIAVGMDFRQAYRAASARAWLDDPPYMLDTFDPEVNIHDSIVTPKGFARLHLVRHLMGEDDYSLSIVYGRDRKVREVQATGWDQHTKNILRR